jgi:hypothetical protein
MKTFFIAGEQRSGTTLLSVILGRHSAIDIDGYSLAFRLVSCFPKFYPQVLPHNLSYSKEEILSWLIKNDYKGRLAELLDHENLDKFSDVRSLIESGISNRLSENGKLVFGDKSPMIQYFAFDLLALIPKVKFIHIVRDARAVALSKKKRTFKNLELSTQAWIDGNVLGLSHQAILGKEVYHIVKYEDLLTEPENTVRAICNFLEIDFELGMITEVRDKSDKQSYVKANLDTSKIESFKTELSNGEIRKIERLAAPLLNKFGYELIFPIGNRPSKPLSIARFIWLNQKDNLKLLFKSSHMGMRNRQNIEISVPFSTRLKTFLLELGRDLLPEKIFKRIFRKRWLKELHLNNDCK